MERPETIERILRPEDISLPKGYKIEENSCQTDSAHRISRINIETGKITICNEQNRGCSFWRGGLERPIDVIFGKENEMFLADFGIFKPPGKNIFTVPNTGVIWRITKS